MPPYTVVYLEPVPPDVEAVVRSRLPPAFALRVRRGDETAASVLTDADFALVATTPLPEAAITAAPRLRLIQHQGVGYDKTDVVAAASCGIPVALCPTGTSVGVAEHVFLLILALYKRLIEADASLRQGQWLQWALRPSSYEIAGKTLGILGLGRIGQEVASRAKAFDADVVYFDVCRPTADIEQALGVRYAPLADVLAHADIVSLHLPHSVDTRHLIGLVELARMKTSAILINTARGPLIDEAALVDALRAGQIAGAGLDVFETEPLQPDHPLLALPNVVLTPHIAAGTVDALTAKMDACFANMLRVSKGDAPLNVVNV
jgi:phosphoglycerate dehydrogenase-like enzyme